MTNVCPTAAIARMPANGSMFTSDEERTLPGARTAETTNRTTVAHQIQANSPGGRSARPPGTLRAGVWATSARVGEAGEEGPWSVGETVTGDVSFIGPAPGGG
jgi:hypothetical protein